MIRLQIWASWRLPPIAAAARGSYRQHTRRCAASIDITRRFRRMPLSRAAVPIFRRRPIATPKVYGCRPGLLCPSFDSLV